MAIRVHGNKDEGKKVRQNYPIQGYPTVLIVKGDGEEYERICGFNGDKEAYFKILQDYAAGKNLLSTFLAELEQSPKNAELNYKVAKKYINRWDLKQAKPYIEKVLALDPDNQLNCREMCQLQLAIYAGRYEKNITPLQQFLTGASEKSHLVTGYHNLVRYYQRIEKDSLKVLEAYDQAIEKIADDAGFLNGYAWYIYQNRIKEKYAQGIRMAQKAVELAPESAGIWDTLSWLIYETGDLAKAVETMKKAHELAPNEKYYKENLEKMEKKLQASTTT